jgi:hypothetical protein
MSPAARLVGAGQETKGEGVRRAVDLDPNEPPVGIEVEVDQPARTARQIDDERLGVIDSTRVADVCQ